MRKLLTAITAVLLTAAIVWAYEYLPPPHDESGTIGGQNGEAWEMVRTKGIELDDVEYDWPDADGTDGYQLTTNGSGTLTWAAAGGSAGDNTLDEAYDQGGAGSGKTITADSGAVAINASSTGGALSLTHSGTGNVLAITNSGSGYDIYGTSGTYYVAKTGNAVFNSLQVPTITGSDVKLDGTYDITWDQSDSELIFNDSARLSLGTSADFKFIFDGSGGDLDVTGDDLELALGADGAGFDIYWHTETASSNVLFDEDNAKILSSNVDLHMDDNADLIIGTGSDFVVESDTAATLEILSAVTDESGTINCGVNQQGIDLKLFGAASGAYLQWDASGNAAILEGADLNINDGDYLNFGDSDDITVAFDGSNGDLDILGAGLEIAIGVNDAGLDVYWHTENDGDNVFFDEDNAKVVFTDVDITMDDDANLNMGSDSDFVIDCDTAKTLDFTPGAATDDYLVNIGLDQSGVDLNLFGTTASTTLSWDASDDTLEFNGADMQLMDDDILAFGDSDEATIRYDEDGDDDLQITGNVSMDNNLAVAGTLTQTGAVTLDSSINYDTTTITAAGPHDGTSVANVNVVKIDTTSNNVTLGGFTGGVDGQVLYVVVVNATNNTVLEHAEGTGNQDIYLVDAGDTTLTASYGGFVLVCDGSNWFEVDHD